MIYILTSPAFKGEIELTYDDDVTHHLKKLEINADLSDVQLISVLERVPHCSVCINDLIKDTKAQLTEVKIELDFATFWKKYDYKIGNKKRAEKLWDALSNSDRAKVIQYIPKYNAFLAQKLNMEKCYPETFLSQRRWEV